jgi:glucose/arabinose dehydrogenase
MDDNLVVDLVFRGLFKPTGMAFLDMDNILVLDRDGGKVYIVTKGKLNPVPALDVNVATVGYRGMLGISLIKTGSNGTIVFLYFTESCQADGDDELENGGMTPLGNRVYRYQMTDSKLTNPRMILDLPAEPGPRHMGGVIVTGPDNYHDIVRVHYFRRPI